MFKSARVREIAGIAGALCLATTLGCSAGGGGAAAAGILTGGDNDGGSLLAAGFVSDEPAPDALSVSVHESAANGNLVTVAVRITDTDDIFTAGFDVDFDPARVEYVNWAPGNLLETGGQSVVYNVARQADRVVVGASRTAPAAGAAATGSEALIHLTFRATSAGSSSVTLSGGFLLDSRPPGPTEIPGVSWSGGRVLAN